MWVSHYPGTVLSQNLFANPGFEDINNCTEYHADCAPEAWFNTPAENYLVKGSQAPKAIMGKNLLLVPVTNLITGPDKNNFVFTMLCCPLVKGEPYKLEFFLHTGGRKFYGLDFYFSEKEPRSSRFFLPGRASLVTVTEQNIVNELKGEWKIIQIEFTAKGNERFCSIGNLSGENFMYPGKDAMNKKGDIFYFLDEMILKPTGEVKICNEYIANKIKLYDQNYRHSPLIRLLPDTLEVPLRQVRFYADTVTIPAVLFETGKAEIKPVVRKILDSLVQQLDTFKISKIDVNGHTDSTGTMERNNILALDRANVIKDYLIYKLPALKESIFAFGRGARFPVATNTTEKGRQRNRRVEIILTKSRMR